MFATAAEFYDCWRPFQFKVSQQVQTQLQRLMKAARDELSELRKGQHAGIRAVNLA